MKISETTHKLLKLLSQVIVADGHIYDSEVKALAECVEALGLKSDSDHLINAEEIKVWFAQHADELSAFKESDNSDVQLTRLILSLADWPEKQQVVDALEKISRADGQVHMEEKLLISIVKAYWQYDGLDAPDSKIDN